MATKRDSPTSEKTIGYLNSDMNEMQSGYLLNVFLHEEINQITSKGKKAKKVNSKEKNTKKNVKPNFNFKAQGRPELVIDLNSGTD